MSVLQAMRFIQAVRSDTTLREQVEALHGEITLADLIKVAAEAGFSFTETELRTAHRQEWSMRALRYDLLVPGQE